MMGKGAKRMEKGNRTFAEMMKPARQWLEGRDPMEIARKSGIEYDAGAACFRLKSLGYDIIIFWPELNVQPEMDAWYPLVILHYMKLADGTPVEGKLIQFSALWDGMVRGGGFDWQSEKALEQIFGACSEDEIRRACQKLGAREMRSNADLCYEFPFLPNYPITLKIWLPDDEFPLSAHLFLDASADHYLTVEDAVTAGSLLLEELRSRQ